MLWPIWGLVGLRVLPTRSILEGLFLEGPMGDLLGSPVVPFYPFSFWAPLEKPNSRKKATLIIKGLLGYLVYRCSGLSMTPSDRVARGLGLRVEGLGFRVEGFRV